MASVFGRQWRPPLQVRLHVNPLALPPLRRLALGYGIECEDASELLKRYLHALADVPLPTKGGSVKGRKLKITEAQRQQRRRQAAEARAKKQPMERISG